MFIHKKNGLILPVLSLSLALFIGISIGLFYDSVEMKNGNNSVLAKNRIQDFDLTSLSFRDIASEVLPVVVQIDVVQVTEVSQGKMIPFDFFGLQPKKNKDDKKEKKREFRRPGMGSGVIVRRDKDKYYVLTNNHVVRDADEITIIMNDLSEFDAKLVGLDERKDLALIQFESKNKELPVAIIGDSDELMVGDFVLAVGSPFGYMSTVTSGIVSAKGRRGPDSNISDFIQTDAAINSGNSGGALVNLKGELVGINTWIATKTGDSAGLGFSIPINNAKKAIEDFIRDGEVEYGWLGVSISNINDEIKEELKVDGKDGAFIHNLYINSPAEKSGLQSGDFVIKINDEKIKNSDDLILIVGDFRQGEKANFTIIRNKVELTQTVTIGKRKDQKSILSNSENLWPGIAPSSINDDIIDYFQLDKKIEGIIVVSVEKGSKMAGG